MSLLVSVYDQLVPVHGHLAALFLGQVETKHGRERIVEQSHSSHGSWEARREKTGIGTRHIL
jgi:hypothetical protein